MLGVAGSGAEKGGGAKAHPRFPGISSWGNVVRALALGSSLGLRGPQAGLTPRVQECCSRLPLTGVSEKEVYGGEAYS